jgi:hypothetical protein
VSVEDQQRADERIPLLLQTPAAVRLLSCEPCLKPSILTVGEICTEYGEIVTYSALAASAHCACCVEWDEPVAWGPLHWAILGERAARTRDRAPSSGSATY